MATDLNVQLEEVEDTSGASAGGLATIDAPAAAAAVVQPTTNGNPSGAPPSPPLPQCTNCQAPMAKGDTFCRRCGFYPTLKTFVEVDPSEAVTEGGEPAVPEPKSHWQILKSLVPRWGKILIGGVFLLLAISLAARFLVPAGAGRAAWTYAQFALGISAVIGAHIACYMSAIMVNDTLGPIDIILKPFAIWSPTVQDLPKSLKRVAIGTWGLSAALFAAVVVAGVNYGDIIDWGKVPPKKKAKKAVVAPVDAPGDDKSLEEALEDFTDKAGVEMSEAERNKLKGNRQKTAKCLIFGFTPSRESDFDSLLIAVEEGGKWRWAGVMNEGFTVDARSVLNRRMRMMRRATPVVPCDLKAFWLEPKLMCTVWYEDWTEDQRLKRPFFDKLQPDFDPAKKPAAP